MPSRAAVTHRIVRIMSTANAVPPTITAKASREEASRLLGDGSRRVGRFSERPWVTGRSRDPTYATAVRAAGAIPTTNDRVPEAFRGFPQTPSTIGTTSAKPSVITSRTRAAFTIQ